MAQTIKRMATTTPITMPAMAPASRPPLLPPPPPPPLFVFITVVVGLGATVTVTVGGASCLGRTSGSGRVFVGAMVEPLKLGNTVRWRGGAAVRRDTVDRSALVIIVGGCDITEKTKNYDDGKSPKATQIHGESSPAGQGSSHISRRCLRR
jgi:hypothetical protein